MPVFCSVCVGPLLSVSCVGLLPEFVPAVFGPLFHLHPFGFYLDLATVCKCTLLINCWTISVTDYHIGHSLVLFHFNVFVFFFYLFFIQFLSLNQ